MHSSIEWFKRLTLTGKGHEVRAVDQTRWTGRSAETISTSFELHDNETGERMEIEMSNTGVSETSLPECEPELEDF